jgi:hypothetical protein
MVLSYLLKEPFYFLGSLNSTDTTLAVCVFGCVCDKGMAAYFCCALRDREPESRLVRS